MSDELRAAAEGVRNAWSMMKQAGIGCPWEYGIYAADPMGATHYHHDSMLLCRAYLDEHPADAAEPLTKGWLKQIGGDYFGEARMCSFTFGGLVGMLWLDPKPITEAEWFIGSGPSRHILPTPRTRGDVRVLCERLGISQQPTTKGDE